MQALTPELPQYPSERTPQGSPPDEVILSQSQKNKIRSHNRIEQAEFKAANEPKLRELHRIRSGASPDEASVFGANDVLRTELAHANEALRRQRNKIRKLKAIIAGIKPASGECKPSGGQSTG